MAISDLMKLVAPPDQPNDIGTPEEWRKIEHAIGIEFPKEYAEFVRVYGSELFAEFYFVYSPFSKNYQSQIERICNVLREHRKSEGEGYAPYPVYPETSGLLPWGRDENGNDYFWLTAGPPDTWRVVQNEVRGSGFQIHDCGMIDFFIGIMQRTIPALACGYPPVVLRCPVETCAGWVYGGDDVPWECEACGNDWDDRGELNEAIDSIVQGRPHRAACYTKKGENFDPAPRENEPPNYETLVEEELEN